MMPPVVVQAALTIVAAAGFLALAVLAAVKRARSPLAVDLGLMSAGLAVYQGLDAAGVITGSTRYDGAAYAAAALFAIPTLRLCMGFIGLSRKLRTPLRAMTGYFVGLAAVTAFPTTVGATLDFAGGDTWAMAMLAGMATAFVPAGVLMGRHARRASAEERLRTGLLLGAMALGVGGAAIDLVLIANGSDLHISPLSFVVSAALVAALVLRAGFLEDVTRLALVSATVVAALAIAAQLVVVELAGTHWAAVAFGTLGILVGVFAALRPLVAALAAERARLDRLALLGRFTAQMVHDMRNPVAAIRGAAQFLQEEHRQGRSLDDQLQFLEVIVERTEHLERVMADYQRMGKMEPSVRDVDVPRLVRRAVDDLHLGQDEAVVVDAELDPAVGHWPLDPDLVERALANLLRNAREAFGEAGGTIRVVVGKSVHDGVEVLSITVEDDGPGMDARTLERAADPFVTTKAQGSGLGLSIATRVAEKHGGSHRIDSALNDGTRVELRLPRDA